MRGRGAAVGVAVIALATIGSTSACGSCDDCPERRPADLVVVGTVTAIGTNGVVRLELDDGQELDVAVHGSLDGLFEDVRYRVPLLGSESGPPTASMPSDCGCGPVITLPDGSEVEVAAPSIRLRAVTALALGATAVVVAVWGVIRWRRGEPL